MGALGAKGAMGKVPWVPGVPNGEVPKVLPSGAISAR
jgi:hypothetical protein